MTTRRRFLTITATAVAFPCLSVAEPIYTWQGAALGAPATLLLAHPDAKAISLRVAAEISRLEDIFSLYRSTSALAELNNASILNGPPFELLECLSLVGAIHRASGGRFDPTIQPLWKCYAEASALSEAPDASSLNTAAALIGWDRVKIGSGSIAMQSGMSLTLNGIAQGYIADRVADMLSAEGLRNILINTGEFRALGGHPSGGAWPVKLAAGGEVPLAGRALATSAPLGTTFDERRQIGHILDPRTGRSNPGTWQELTVSAESAALADALSTAACLIETREGIDALMAQFPSVKLESAVAA